MTDSQTRYVFRVLDIETAFRLANIKEVSTLIFAVRCRSVRDLERDVQLGVLEKVGPNMPVTWCSRMVATD